MMEKRGIADESTPSEKPGCGKDTCKKSCQTKEAADAQEAHTATRLSDAAAKACSQPKK